MKRVGPVPFNKVVELWLADNPVLKKQFREARIIDAWKTAMGDGIMAQTGEIYYTGQSLVVHIKSAILRNELNMRRQKIMEMLKETLGDDVPSRLILK